MVFVTVDNNFEKLRSLSSMIFNYYPGSVVCEFTDPMLSVKYICNHAVDVVFARRQMRPVDGEAIANVIRMHKPDVKIILVNDGEEVSCVRQM